MRNCIRVVDTTSCTVCGTKQQLPSLVNLYNICRQTDTKNNHTIYGLYQNFTDLTCLSCVKVLESQRHGLVKSIQVLHTHSVSRSLPSCVYLCRNTHPKITRMCGYMTGLDHFMISTSDKVFQSLIYVGFNCIQVTHTYSVSQPQQYLTTFILSTSDNVLKSLSYVGIKSMEVPHTYSVSQPLPSYSWNFP